MPKQARRGLAPFFIAMFSLLLAIIYLAFICLGLPDSLLGSAWPSMYQDLGVRISFSGIVSMLISLCTIISSFFSGKIAQKFTTKTITVASVALTALGILGFSFSSKFWMVCIFAIPYGLGAGGVDAALNNYVALHYQSKHMSWLHCAWGLGAIVGPYIMGYALTRGIGWNKGYFIVAIIQCIFTALLIFTLPLWKKGEKKERSEDIKLPRVSYREVLKTKGVLETVITFFCYCALEQTTILWAGSYMVIHNGVSEALAANYASLFFVGMTVGRAINGFFAMKFRDEQMIRVGQLLILFGALLVFVSTNIYLTICGFLLIGLGCAPIYPCIIHSTPFKFGVEKSQSMIGLQMAFAYVGSLAMPPLFGVIADYISIHLLSPFLLVLLFFMVLTQEKTLQKTAYRREML